MSDHNNVAPKEASERMEAIREAGHAIRLGNLAHAQDQLDKADRLGRIVEGRLRTRLDYEDIP